MRIAVLLVGVAASSYAQTMPSAEFKLALAQHSGQLRWRADGFRIIEMSAKPNDREIGIRGQDASGRLTFLGFLFLVPEQAPFTAAKCRDGAVEPEKKGNPTFKMLESSEISGPGGRPVSIVAYSSRAKDGTTWYTVRGFVAVADVCGDLEFYAKQPIGVSDPDLAKVFSSYALDEHYRPTFADGFVYAQTLYRAGLFKAAAPIFEIALARLVDDPAPLPSVEIARRVTTDQAGMSYGIAGETAKARAMFEKAIATDPEYPMYYYNLACADAQERKLRDAQRHLQAAFERKANMIPGEPIPDPTKDDSFLPFKRNKEFWSVLEKLQASR